VPTDFDIAKHVPLPKPKPEVDFCGRRLEKSMTSKRRHPLTDLDEIRYKKGTHTRIYGA